MSQITAKFTADFGDFDRAVKGAEVELKRLETGAATVGTSLSRMVNQFTGRKVIQDANLMVEAIERIGGTSRLTEKELARVQATAQEATAKMRAMGIEIPPGLQKIADSVKPITSLTEQATARMTALGAAVGTFIGNFAFNVVNQGISALTNFAREAITSTGALVDLSNKTGLTTETIQRMSYVADQTGGSLEGFTKAAFQLGVRLNGGSTSVVAGVTALGLSLDSLRRLSPDAQFSAIVAALERMVDPQERNRIALDLFGRSAEQILPAVAEGYSQLAAQAGVSSDAQVQAIDRQVDAFDRWKANTITGIRSVIGEWVLWSEALNKLTPDQIKRWIEIESAQGQAAAKAYVMARRFEDIELTAGPATTAVASYAEQLTRAQTEMKGLTAADLAEIAAARQLGISTQEVADRLGVSTTAIGLASAAINAKTNATDTLIESEKALLKVENEALLAQDKALTAAHQATLARADANADGLRLMQIDFITFEEETAAAAEKARTEEMDAWLKSVNGGVLIVGQAIDAVDEKVNASIERTKQAAAAAVTSWSQAMLQVNAGQGKLTGTVQAGGYFDATRAQIQDSYMRGEYWGPVDASGHPDWKRLPTARAQGGPVTSGTPYLVGERGPELFVPGSSGAVLPSGAGAVSIQIDARNSFYTSSAGMQQLADVVNRAVVASMRAKGWKA